MNRWAACAVLFAFALALAFRFPQLDTRPLHNDEAVNAVKVADLWENGRYRYDPDEYHGPTLHYATLPFLSASGAPNTASIPDASLRWVTVAFGVATILALFLFKGVLSPSAIAWSALFIAISPAMVFYSRYFIHEMLLIFFTVTALGAGARYALTKHPAWALLCGASIGLMYATKETFVLTAAAMAGALLGTVCWTVGWRNALQSLSRLVPRLHLLYFAGGALLMWLLFFSSFLTNFQGLIDSVLTYFPWLKRAAGHSPHLHPWYFYLQRLAWFNPAKGPVFSELLILLLACVGGFSALRNRQTPLPFFLSLYSLLLASIYSLITYKTPWCLLNFYIGILLLAGIGAAFLVQIARSIPSRILVTSVILAASAQLGVQAWRASYTYASDRRNPYVYAQTVPDLLNLVNRVEGVASSSPDRLATVVKVIAKDGDYWPLPWYLRRLQNIGWYDSLPDDPFAPIIIASADFEARLDDKSDRKWIMAGLTELRPGTFFELYVELGLWTRYVATLPPPPDE